MSISFGAAWWEAIRPNVQAGLPEGLLLVEDYVASKISPPEEVVVMERARQYGAVAVFFSASEIGKPPVAQAFVYDEHLDNERFALLHKKLWSWGGIPLVYRRTAGALQLYRCGHQPDFMDKSGRLRCNPIRTLRLAGDIESAPWWDATQLRNGTLWDDPATCRTLLSANKAAHQALVLAIGNVYEELNQKGIFPEALRRKLLILTLLIAYLEQREAFVDGYFGRFVPNATRFFQVLANGPGLVRLLRDLEARFNGSVFEISEEDRDILLDAGQLERFSGLVEARQEQDGQLSLWDLYSFKDLPVELVSHIYQLFVQNQSSSIYTPPHLVRLVLEEALGWDRLDELMKGDGVILDCSCGSGVFLVEGYKRLVTHWRSRNQWRRPDVRVLRKLLERVHGIDLEAAAVELAAFSLCLALCDALEPEELRSSVQLFPNLIGKSLLPSCFFLAQQEGRIKRQVFCVVGNPPFDSRLETPASQVSYEAYRNEFSERIPDNQVAYLFLHEAMRLLQPGGVLAMLQQYNLLYNQGSRSFRRTFFEAWDVREILDFVSVRGLFRGGKADTKVVVIIAEANRPVKERDILHATFRRTGRAEAEQGFDIDYYDLHWITRETILTSDTIWRSNLLGGGRTHLLMERLKRYPTLADFADAHDWIRGEGFIEAKPSGSRASATLHKLAPALHLTGKPLIPADALTPTGLDRKKVETVQSKRFKSAYSAARFTAPMVVVHQQLDLNHAYIGEGYYTYKNQIVGFCAPRKHRAEVRAVGAFIQRNKKVMQAFVAGTSIKLFTQHATTLSAADILKLPYPLDEDLNISENEEVIIKDIVDHYRDLVRFADRSFALTEPAHEHLAAFTDRFLAQLNAVYGDQLVRSLPTHHWPGVICQPFQVDQTQLDWTDSETVQATVARLLHAAHGESLRVTRVCRLYENGVIFLLKPDRLRYWLPSVALRDADDVMADLRSAELA